MRNKYPGKCYHCGAGVAKGAGQTKPTRSPDPNARPKWYTIHIECLKIRAKRAKAQNEAEKKTKKDEIK